MPEPRSDLDVLVVGAGPAGALTALLVARAGARVRIVDRDAFPRRKLCGDTLNPGAVRLLERLGLGGGPMVGAPRLAGMMVTGPGVRATGRYGGACGRAIVRREFDEWLLSEAERAGARFESGVVVRAPVVGRRGQASQVEGVHGVRRGAKGSALTIRASITVGADGRRSRLASALGLSRHPPTPRRWAYGVYASGVTGTSDVGEMHIHPGGYLGIAPVGAGLTNVCAVTGPHPGEAGALDVVRRAIARDSETADRFRQARFESPVAVLGPMAVDVRQPGVAGLLLAGDAAGFVDPMTGDGLRLALHGAELAAAEVLRALGDGALDAAAVRLANVRQKAFGRKLRFNRVLRRLVDSPPALTAAGWLAAGLPSLVRQAVTYAGDAR